MACGWRWKTQGRLEPMWCDAWSWQRTLNSVQVCSVLHDAHVGVRRVTVVIVHIGHEEVVVVIYFCVAIFVVIFCIWRCTLYRARSPSMRNPASNEIISDSVELFAHPTEGDKCSASQNILDHLPKLILSPQGRQQNLSLGINPIDNAEPCHPHDNIVSSLARGTTGSSMFAHGFGHLCRGRRIHTSGHSDAGILSNLGASSNFTWVYADTAPAACPSQSGSLAMTSNTFVGVIRDADEPCSEKTTGPRVDFYNVTSEYDWSFFLKRLVLTPHFLRWQMSISVAKWTFFFVSLCFQNNLLFALDFSQILCWNCLEIFPCLVHGTCCIRNLHRLWHGNELVHQMLMGHRSKSFACNVVFMVFRLRGFHSMPCGSMTFQDTTLNSFWSPESSWLVASG